MLYLQVVERLRKMCSRYSLRTAAPAQRHYDKRNVKAYMQISNVHFEFRLNKMFNEIS